MSTLPPFSPFVTWRDYKIGTPTFDLTPIEKPDMSPFLVHMTGRAEILDILNGKNSASPVPSGHGYLKAAVPDYQGSTRAFDAKVVCFTETPTFALDFFRYRSYPRWAADQIYGVGFFKTPLAKSGARPVVYLDDDATRQLISLRKSLGSVAPTTGREGEAKELLDTIFPFVFPLLDTLPSQGFMWEREWRIPDPGGFVFPHSDVGIICCPETEEGGIRAILGSAAANIQFVRTWREYDAVTDFLRRQQPAWIAGRIAVHTATSNKDREVAARNLVNEITASLHTLASYEGVAVKHSEELERIAAERLVLEEQLMAAQHELAAVTSTEASDKENDTGDMGLAS